MVEGKRVTVVGAGAIGLSAAYYLQSAGADVVLVDRGQAGDAASSGNAGWITPMMSSPVPAPGIRRVALKAFGRPSSPLFIPPRPDPALAKWLWQFWRHCNADDYRSGRQALAQLNQNTLRLFDELKADGVDFPMWHNGLLVVFRDQQAAEQELSGYQALAEFGYEPPTQIESARQLHELEPALDASVTSGFLLPQERHLDPVAFTRGMAKRVVERGGVIRENFQVTGFRTDAGQVTRVESAEEAVETDFVLIAAGARSGQVARKLRVDLPIQGGKGYSFSFRSQNPPRHPLYLGDSRVGVSYLQDGRVRVAGTMEFSGLELKVKQRRIASVAGHAQKFLAEDVSGPFDEQWVGMRPLTFDGLPIVGRAERFPNVFVSTGHSMLGMTLAPATGEALAEYLSSGRPPQVLTGLTPARFSRSASAGVVP